MDPHCIHQICMQLYKENLLAPLNNMVEELFPQKKYGFLDITA